MIRGTESPLTGTVQMEMSRRDAYGGPTCLEYSWVPAALASGGKLMPKVIYKGNGNTSGSVPADNNNYAANASFTVAGPGSLSL